MTDIQQVLFFDCQIAGVSGDMILGALLDLGVKVDLINTTARTVKETVPGCRDLKIKVEEVSRGGLRAKRIEVETDDVSWRSGEDLVVAVKDVGETLQLTQVAKKFILGAIETLVKVEADLHGKDMRRVHLHESGSVDTIFELLAVGVVLDSLDLFRNGKFYSTPVAVGGGTFKFSHGNVSSPSPATLEILKRFKIPLVGGPVKAELATPTGVSIIVNLIDKIDLFYPPMKPLRVGYGAGLKDHPETPNFLRLVLGESLESGFHLDEVVVLETNLDDVTGETLGYTIERLFEEGARDVFLIPTFTKKGRPGHLIRTITENDRVHALSKIIFEETGTLGVRIQPCNRFVLSRDSVEAKIHLGGLKRSARVKVSRDTDGKIIRVKPEYEDVKSIAKKTGKPLREVNRLIEDAAKKTLGV